MMMMEKNRLRRRKRKRTRATTGVTERWRFEETGAPVERRRETEEEERTGETAKDTKDDDKSNRRCEKENTGKGKGEKSSGDSQKKR